MEVIRLSGYIEREKVEIGKRYIIPRSLERHGLKATDVKFEREALTEILQGYVKEAGLRNFEKSVDKISRKIARKRLEDEISFPYVVKRVNIRDFLGERSYWWDGKTLISFTKEIR